MLEPDVVLAPGRRPLQDILERLLQLRIRQVEFGSVCLLADHGDAAFIQFLEICRNNVLGIGSVLHFFPRAVDSSDPKELVFDLRVIRLVHDSLHAQILVLLQLDRRSNVILDFHPELLASFVIEIHERRLTDRLEIFRFDCLAIEFTGEFFQVLILDHLAIELLDHVQGSLPLSESVDFDFGPVLPIRFLEMRLKLIGFYFDLNFA